VVAGVFGAALADRGGPSEYRAGLMHGDEKRRAQKFGLSGIAL
jgi:hypothetical protein